MQPPTPTTVLQVDDLQVEFRTDHGVVRAVDGLSFTVRRGETLGIVGESGSGKSVTSLALLGLIPQPPGRVTAGRAIWDDLDLLQLRESALQSIRGRRIAMIFQDPMTSLNPFLTIGEQLMEITRRHLNHTRPQARRHAAEMLERVGIHPADRRLDDYPHQYSGGMRQRVLVAMALTCRPELLIADEPTTALDVSIQAQILDLIQELADAQGTAVILITHDMGIVAARCQRVVVMYAGRAVEESPVRELFARPRHPYTRGLLGSIPRLDRVQDRLTEIAGQPPDLSLPIPGCAFAPRCPHRVDRCDEVAPPLETWSDQRRAACWVSLEDIETNSIPSSP